MSENSNREQIVQIAKELARPTDFDGLTSKWILIKCSARF